ncbi:5-formyltetrahydrofolate cyclo-ligase [Novosphingobium album (ex Liu et al. 2023)]|uniref:5-formyltetrahydrofolate cyclo-ligase n=1 Tax=Novosphingobium album (ex Liu et al. 2023) TaxID=3031130 RepID=A0ABT5WTK8_9SPHN|nr:5-formyltetrahydrofolate cyclo-ligase [Novosphingobium album (ex Liu et al. 2023)]MDE8653220.1 5-formyltetrahydrofolate cyclo-ligase [Novosphingobium album (ex Liu et al. 2023)]
MDPSPPLPAPEQKARLREALRRLRRDHVAALPGSMMALMFLRPPVPVAAMVPEGVTVGLYRPVGAEAPTLAYAKWLHENGRQLALPRFASRDAPMTFGRWTDPYDEDELEAGPFGAAQPRADADDVTPGVVFVPLLGFTARGDRLGQGGGHYDRWLAAHPETVAIGLGWDCQLVESLAVEPHDRPLHAVVTPTRLYTESE